MISIATSGGMTQNTSGSTTCIRNRPRVRTPQRGPPFSPHAASRVPLRLYPPLAQELRQGLRPAVAVDARQGRGALGDQPALAGDLVLVVDADRGDALDGGAHG